MKLSDAKVGNWLSGGYNKINKKEAIKSFFKRVK